MKTDINFKTNPYPSSTATEQAGKRSLKDSCSKPCSCWADKDLLWNGSVAAFSVGIMFRFSIHLALMLTPWSSLLKGLIPPNLSQSLGPCSLDVRGKTNIAIRILSRWAICQLNVEKQKSILHKGWTISLLELRLTSIIIQLIIKTLNKQQCFSVYFRQQ